MTENERIRELRKARGLTLEEFGERVGVRKSAVSKIERAETSVTEQMRRSICREFGVREEWLRTGEGPMEEARDRDEELKYMVNSLMSGESASFKKRLIAVLSSLNESQWVFLEQKLMEIVQAKEEAADEIDVDAEVEAYRRQLIEEKKAAAKSAALRDIASGTA